MRDKLHWHKDLKLMATIKQGVYVLTDSAFRPFGRMSMAVRSEAISMAQAVSNPFSINEDIMGLYIDLVPLVSLRYHPGRVSEFGYQHDSAG